MQPFFAPGQIVVKRLVGLPGDHVAVTPERTAVNGVPVGEGLALAPALGQLPEAFVREQSVPADAVWMMGGTPDSFDSRYWGPLPMAQILGRAYALY
jgi:conjugal transfer pilin signal peptidase TrbI